MAKCIYQAMHKLGNLMHSKQNRLLHVIYKESERIDMLNDSTLREQRTYGRRELEYQDFQRTIQKDI